MKLPYIVKAVGLILSIRANTISTEGQQLKPYITFYLEMEVKCGPFCMPSIFCTTELKT